MNASIIKRVLLLGVLLQVFNNSNISAENMQAYFADFSNSATLEDVNSTTAVLTVPADYSTCASAPPNILFSVGFTSGLAYREGVLYGLEWGAGSLIYLYSVSAGPCAIGTRVDINTDVGHSNLESLAYCQVDDSFYSVDFDYGSPHLGQLVRIDPVTGVGTLLGSHMTFDVRITGMVCDSSGQLWAVTPGHGSRASELLKINRNTGVETVVGATGIGATIAEALAFDRDKPNELFISGKALYAVNTLTGQASLIAASSYNQIWAMAGLPLSDLIFMDGFE